MVITYFDVLPRCKCEVLITYPTTIKSQVKELIKQLEYVSFLNKRRATIESMQVK